ncbi:hypothetical protein D3C85_1337650 [compost metagenome]
MVIIANYHDVWPVGIRLIVREVVEDAHLRHVGILKLVHHDVLVFFLKVVAQLGKNLHAVDDA